MYKCSPAINIKYRDREIYKSAFRTVLMYFALSGLDLLHQLGSLTEQRKQYIIDWIYSLQIVNNKGSTSTIKMFIKLTYAFF